MAVIRIKDFIGSSSFAGNRISGAKIRDLIIEEIKRSDNGVTLDFALIDMITQSFGDEILGILTRMEGVDYIKKNIRLVNHSDDIKDILNYVVKYSRKHHNGEVA